jgi:hypothetical protein
VIEIKRKIRYINKRSTSSSDGFDDNTKLYWAESFPVAQCFLMSKTRREISSIPPSSRLWAAEFPLYD